MLKRLMILIFMLFSSIIRLVAQSSPSVNKNVTFLNSITENITKSTACIESFYNILTSFNETNSIRYIHYSKLQCIFQPREYYYKEANNPTNSIVQDSWELYNQLYEKNNEIIAYVRLEDHKADKGARGFQMIEEMETIIEGLIKNRNTLQETIYATSKDLRQDNSTKPYQLLLDLITHEEKVLAHLDSNYREGAVGLDEEFINKSYLKTQEILLKFKTVPDSPYPSSSYLKSLLSGVEKLQNLKKSAVDKNNYINKSSTRYVNKVYKNYLNHFNNEVISFSKLYIDNYSDLKRSGAYLYPKYIPRYRLKEYNIEVTVKSEFFEDKVVPTLEITNQSTILQKDHFNILNDYILSLNTRTRSINSIDNSLKNFQISLNRLKSRDQEYLNKARLSFKFDYYVVPENDLAIYKKQIPKLFPAYSTSLLTQINTIQEVMLEGERLCEELAIYGYTKKFIDGDFSRPEEILERLSVLFDTYEIKKEMLYGDIRAIYTSYKVKNPANPWKITSNAMLKAVDTEKDVLKNVKKKFFSGNKGQISPQSLIDVRRDLITNQSKYMSGIRRIGKNNGHCPYNPYERMPDELERMSDKLLQLDEYIEKEQFDKYREYVYRYNELTEDYNKFSQLGKGEVESAQNDTNRPAYILSQTIAVNKSISSQNALIEEIEVSTKDQEFTSFKGFPHNNLVFLLDVSGSMRKEDKLPLLKKSINYLVSLMRQEDEISIVVYSGKAQLFLNPSSAIETEKIKNIIATLKSEGKTNVNDGIKLAYKTAKDNFKENGNNRIILATDGELKINNKSKNLVQKYAEQNIQLSVFIFGSKTTSSNLQSLSKVGEGNFNHITSKNSNEQMIREAKSKKIH